MSPALEAHSLNHWTAIEVPSPTILKQFFICQLYHSKVGGERGRKHWSAIAWAGENPGPSPRNSEKH